MSNLPTDPPSSSSQVPPKERIRAHHAKTRSGCTTCKIRRVKCDETHPSCLKCIKFWGKCDGYPTPSQGKRRVKRIASKNPELPIRPFILTYHHHTPPTPLQSLSRQRFSSQLESDNFQTFTNDLAAQLPGFFTSTVWSEVMLQASHSEDFVKDAVIAIGALHTCGRRLMESKHTKVTSGIEVTPRYRFALQQWGLALKKMQKRISGGEKGLRMALIACLLVVCFENLQGNYFQGLKHAVSGHTLLQAWLDKQETPISRKEGLESPSPHVIEDELVLAFSRLDLQIMAYVDPRGASTHQSLKNSGAAVINAMPMRFISIEEARRYWELIQRRSSHFIATIATMAQAEGNMQELTKVGVGTETVACYSESAIMLSLSPSQDQDARRQCIVYSREIKRWFDAFAPFYNSLSKVSREWLAGSILHIQAKTSEIMLLASLFGDEFSLDNFEPTFRELIDLGKEVASDDFFKTEHLFTFDTMLVNPVRLIAKWCREPTIRREAIALLRSLAAREGIWDALTMASISEYVMFMEEEGRDANGYIPRKKRVRITGLVVDGLERRTTVSCRRVDGSEERVTVVTW